MLYPRPVDSKVAPFVLSVHPTLAYQTVTQLFILKPTNSMTG